MKKRVLFFILILLLCFGGAFLFINFVKQSVSAESFQVDSVLLKTAIKSNGSFDVDIKVTNTGERKHFDIKIVDLEGLIFPDLNSFDLDKSETKIINILFANTPKIKEGVYVGALEISALNEKKVIPIILEIESEDTLFDSNIAIFPIGKISPGDKINAEIRIFDLSKIGTASVEMGYFIKNFMGEKIVSETENLVVKDQVLITKSVNLPNDMKEGDYAFGVVLKYKNSVGTSSSFFRVEKKGFTKGFSELNSSLIYLMVFFVFILLILLIFVFYSVYSSDKLLVELKNQYKEELKRQYLYIKKREESSSKALKTAAEREISKKIFAKVRRQREKELERIHNERIRKLKHLRKTGRKERLLDQIEQWKKGGYNTSLLETKIKVPTTRDIKKQIRNWKKKGYDTALLEGEFR